MGVVNCAKYSYVVFLYYWMIFVSIISDVKSRIIKLKPIPYTQRNDFVAVVTGGGRGLGEFIVKGLLRCGMTVVVGVRNQGRCQKLIDDAEKLPGKMVLMHLDVSEMKSVSKFAEDVRKKYSKINILVNNAGIIYRDTEETTEGFDPILATNYLGHFLLSHLLLENLEAAGKSCGWKSRIINVASCAHVAGTINLDDINMKKNFIRLESYGRSKLAQLMTSRYLNARLKSMNFSVMSTACHPGVVASNMSGDWKATYLPVTKTLLTEKQGARHALFCALDDSIKGGEYFYNDGEGYSTRESKDEAKQRMLFEFTCKMLNIKSFFN